MSVANDQAVIYCISLSCRNTGAFTVYYMYAGAEHGTAVEVKDKQSLHRYIQLLVERTVDRRQYETGITELKSVSG